MRVDDSHVAWKGNRPLEWEMPKYPARKVAMKMNKSVKKVPAVLPDVYTHEGGPAKVVTPLLALRRAILATMLWEDGFYESGEEVAKRVASLVKYVEPRKVASLAIEARTKGKLRHIPLLLVREMARLSNHKYLVADTLDKVIQRPDELAEFLAIYFKT